MKVRLETSQQRRANSGQAASNLGGLTSDSAGEHILRKLLTWLLFLLPLPNTLPGAEQPDFAFSLVGSTHAVKIQLRVILDGQPFADVLRLRFGHLFAHLDRDGSEGIDADELEAAPSAGWMRRAAWGYLPANHSELVLLADVDRDRDHCVSPAELQAWYTSHGFGGVAAVAGRSSNTRVLSAAIWQVLDSNKDGLLSSAECACATEMLRKLDEDDDELIEAKEIASYVELPYAAPTARWNERRFDIVTAPEPRAAISTSFSVEVRLSSASTGLSVIPAATKVGTQAEPFITDLTTGESPLGIGVVLPLGNHSCSLLALPEARSRWRECIGPMAAAGFAAADQNQDRLVTAEEAAGASNRCILALYKFADHDRDRRITHEEWETALNVIGPLMDANVHLTILCHEGALFELLDVNRDAFVSRAELQATPSLLRARSRDELPTVLTVFISRGQTPVIPQTPSPIAPAWFVAMDRNHDGVISRIEFIGDLLTFHKLDGNRDSQISPSEAMQKMAADSLAPTP